VRLDDWFLTAAERGNAHSAIDRRRAGVAWTQGNHAEVLIDGVEYFARLHAAVSAAAPGDSIYLTGLEGAADERLAGAGTEVARVFGELAERGVQIMGLLWRSHGATKEPRNLLFSRALNTAGGHVLLDNRIRRGGSHHQKIVVVRRQDPTAHDVAFVGGMDLVYGRHDDHTHRGDPQAAEVDADHYDERPGWHDVQVSLRGPAVDDVAFTFRERWEDPAPLDRRNPVRWLQHRLGRHPVERVALPAERPVVSHGDGPHAVQVLRTYPARRKRYPFAPDGERSIARAYIKAFGRARRLIYLEDQYLWSFDATELLCDALRREPDLRVVIVIPRYPDPAGRIAGAASVFGRERVQDALYAAGGDRVAIYDLERDDGTAVYVHSKACIVDDLWLAVGSDNLNRRSWTHDSEISCAIVDDTRDEREPRDPAGRGEGARTLARDTRLRLAVEHTAGSVDPDAMIDPEEWFDALRRSAAALDAWHLDGEGATRPPGHLRAHPIERVRARRRGLLHLAHAHVLDPDGRPRALKRRDAY